MNIFRYIILSTLCIFASAIHDQPAKMQNIIWVTTDTDNGWHFSGHMGLNPDLTLQRDTAYTFMMNAPDHKMIIYEYPNNVIAQSPDNGRGHFNVNFNEIYHHDIRYKESNKSFMSGKINLIPQQQPCCEADTAQCQACKLGWNVTQYCHHFPSKTGCDQVAPYCCKALIASCLACDLGLSVHEYCSIRPDVQGCESEHHAHHAMESKFTLDFNYFTIGYIGSNERNTWTSTLRGEMAVIMGINKNRIHVDKLSPVDSTGILVDFSIDEGPSSELSPEQAIELLNGMILNTASALWTSDSLSILSKVNRVKSWPLPQQEHHTHNITNNQTINNVTQHHEHHYHSHDEDVDHDEVNTHNYQDDHDHEHYHNDNHYVNHYHYYDNDYYHYHEDKDHGHNHGYEDNEEYDDGHHHDHNDHGHHHHEDDHDHSWRHDHQDGEYSDEYASVEHTHDHDHDDNISEIAIWIISGVGLIFIIGLVIYMLVSGKNKNYEGRQERTLNSDDYQALIA